MKWQLTVVINRGPIDLYESTGFPLLWVGSLTTKLTVDPAPCQHVGAQEHQLAGIQLDKGLLHNHGKLFFRV